MGIATLIRFLVGQRQAIVDVAQCRQAFWVGLLLVLSAGFAREYNQEDLLRDGWYLAVPLIASLATSLLLFALLALAAKLRAATPVPFWEYYRSFLSLYWMTAPLAWLYALPVENFLDSADAVRVNLSLLALVSLWRVLLITRATVVLLGASFWAAFFLVMLFADTLALVILIFTPLPVFNIMGGIPLTESEQVIRDIACNVQFFGGVSWLIWFIGSLVVMGIKNPRWVPLPLERDGQQVSEPLWALVAASLVVWFFVLPTTQPPQQRRRAAEAGLLNGEVADALRTMSAHEKSDFPPHWDPPPWHGYGHDKPPLVEVLRAIDEHNTAEWVKAIYTEKLARNFNYLRWDSMNDETFAAMMRVLENPRYQTVVLQHAKWLKGMLEHPFDDDPQRREQIAQLLEAHHLDTPAEEATP